MSTRSPRHPLFCPNAPCRPAPPVAPLIATPYRHEHPALAASVVPMSIPPPQRCGFVAIVGAPNAGKSTLMNRLTGAKLSIVSPKAQTTRFRVLGILMRAESQVLLVDTPGIFRPKRKLDRAMVAAAWTGAADADLAILLVDAKSGLREEVREIAQRLATSGRRCWLVLNKTDLVTPPALLPLIAALAALANFEETFMVSAQTGDGIRRLADALAEVVPVGPWLYPEDDLTDLPDRLLAAETVREQIFMQTHEEVPYGATVETESFKDRKDGSVRIEVTIYVARPGHKAILIGDKGSKIKAIGARARQDLAGLLDRPVHLFLNVKERKGWDEEGARLRAIGLDDPGKI
jgi:GTPase